MLFDYQTSPSIYDGPCSDCGNKTSTDKAGGGTAFTDGLTADKKLGAVYLLCAPCKKEWGDKGARGPGKYHKHGLVQPRS